MSEIKLFGARIIAPPPHNQKDRGADEGGRSAPDTTVAEKAAAAAAVSGLPCPRCKSRETKFCYFNNYNVNQPRHFCRGCQRYWTSGGTLRNVPVGAGRRKVRPHPHVEGAEFYAPAFDGVAMEQWILGHDGFPTKRPNNST